MKTPQGIILDSFHGDSYGDCILTRACMHLDALEAGEKLQGASSVGEWEFFMQESLGE